MSTVSKYVYKLEPVLGMWRFKNLFVDFLQEAPYFLAVRVKADSDYGANQAEKKRELRGGTPCKILFVIFS